VETAAHTEALLAYLARVTRTRTLDVDTPLVSSGLLDSFMLVEVLVELERVTRRRIPAGRVSPTDFETVRGMLEAAERVGTPAPR
jgi:acyl carrier protein